MHQATHLGLEVKRVIDLRPGLRLHFCRFTPRKTLNIHFETNDPGLRFSFLYEGKGCMDWRISRGSVGTTKSQPIKRSSSVFFYPELAGRVCFPAGHRQSHFSIQIALPLLQSILNGRFQRMPYDFQAIVQGCKTINFHHNGTLSPVMDAAIGQIVNCPYSGPLGLLFQESKVIELIAHKVAQIESLTKPTPVSSKIRRENLERVYHAKEILQKNLESPPKLFDLAHSVGTSHTLLNKGFRELYGTSVFGHLRNMRLEKARYLLENGSMNVTEAALAVGYNSISSFSRAFSDHFGLNPLNFITKD